MTVYWRLNYHKEVGQDDQSWTWQPGHTVGPPNVSKGEKGGNYGHVASYKQKEKTAKLCQIGPGIILDFSHQTTLGIDCNDHHFCILFKPGDMSEI